MDLLNFVIILVISLSISGSVRSQCDTTTTTASGSLAPSGPICAGDLIFQENFDNLNPGTWQHEVTLGGGGNNEFQWYTSNQSNSYVNNGILFITPTLTADQLGEEFLSSGTLNLDGGPPAYEQCNNALFNGCSQVGSPNNIIQPIKSARLRTSESFSFKYGRVEIRAKLPAGDWLWPAIWFLPTKNIYGTWPASGEIDLMESRGNLNLMQNGVNIGAERVGSTLHFGPYWPFNGYETSTYSKNSPAGNGFDKGFHNYQMNWTTDGFVFLVDNEEIGRVPVGEGFWKRGGFDKNPDLVNVWKDGTLMAPFDQEFHVLLNEAVGGTAYFPDGADNPNGKPWSNGSPQAKTDFWNSKNQWLPTWRSAVESSLQIDYIRIWAMP